MKRVLDLLIGLMLIVPFLLVALVVGLLIKLDSRGPVLFAQKRLGRDGRVFIMYKFRTMVTNAEKMREGLFSYADDPRVTRVGRVLRRTSVDELPQILNVLLGNMSIVGPRPPVTYELGDYANFTAEMKVRFRLKPGITGLAQVCGRNDLDWPRKIQFDNLYVKRYERWGVLEDLRILCLTVWVVVGMRNVIEKKAES